MSLQYEEFKGRLSDAVGNHDRPEAERLCEELVAHLRQCGDACPELEARSVLGLLRRQRYFDLMSQIADALIASGQNAPAVRRQYAQALIDRDMLAPAISYLEALVKDTSGTAHEHAEARGLLGRAYKELFLREADPSSARAHEYLNRSIEWYRDTYVKDRLRRWHGINSVALLMRAHRDDVPIETVPAARESAQSMASQMLGDIERAWLHNVATAWDCSTAAEACVALERNEEALTWAARYVQEPATDTFELTSSLRQLRHVWQLDTDSDPGARVIPLLAGELLTRREGGSIEIQPSLVSAGGLERSAMGLEALLGAARYVSYQFMIDAIARAKAVGRVESSPGQGFGTGFLVRGGDLREDLGDELLFLTNSHVISDDEEIIGAIGSLHPDEASIVFHVFGDDDSPSQRFDELEVLWTSSPLQLDATLLRIHGGPTVDPFPVARRLPVKNEDQRVYVVGHPGGRELSFSIQDNVVLDHEPPRIHYRAPTEKGSSGSPVFNQQWKLLALHHSGKQDMRKLNGKSGTYQANEGIWIQSIREGLNSAS